MEEWEIDYPKLSDGDQCLGETFISGALYRMFSFPYFFICSHVRFMATNFFSSLLFSSS